MSTNFCINDPRTSELVKRMTDSGDFGSHTSFGVERDGKIIAGVVFTDYNKVSASVHIAAEPGSRWLTRAFAKLVFGYAFDCLKLKRLTGLVSDKNQRAKEFDSAMGFKYEATLENAHPEGNLLVFRMFREDCRWLNV